MFSFSLFAFSGLAIMVMLLAKRFQEKRRKTFFILKAISRGDERVRELHHQSIHYYSIGKEKTAFWVKKQLPMRAKNSWNKFQAYTKEVAERHMGDMRNSRLLKKSDGISEFFKNISEIEKGAGEINEVYEEREEVVVSAQIIEPAPIEKVKKPRAPRKKKLVVVEVD